MICNHIDIVPDLDELLEICSVKVHNEIREQPVS